MSPVNRGSETPRLVLKFFTRGFKKTKQKTNNPKQNRRLGVHHKLDEVSCWTLGMQTECLGTLQRPVLHRVDLEEIGEHKQNKVLEQLSDIFKINET